MRRLCAASVICVVSAVAATTVDAWGPSGHRIVAMIAAEHLTPAAAAKVNTLLQGASLEDVANFADVVRDDRPETKNWHFVDIPKNKTAYDPARDCASTPEGDCVIAALDRLAAILGNPAETTAKRAEALKFIVHFVGDLHQPMHSADNNDRGGNAVKVKFFGRRSNLHAVWDSGIIAHADLTEDEFATDLLNGIVTNQVPAIQSGTVVDWAVQAHKLAVTKSYANLPASGTVKQLGQVYYDRTFETVDLQLTRAGLRLAKIINAALGS